MSSEENQQQPATTTEENTAPPAAPTSEPPVEDPKPEVAAASEEIAPADDAAAPATDATAKPEEKKPSRLKKRLTLKWGKNRDQIEAPKEPEQQADPRADVVAWIAQQIPAAVHKVNYGVLDWAQKLAVEDESARQPLPGKDGQVTRNQFLAFLRDGDVLMKLANKLQPGAIEPATLEEGADAEKQKEAKTKNVEAFAKWSQEALGVEEEKAMKSSDLLDNGKNGYPAVFDTLWSLGLKAQEKFSQEGVDVDAIVAAASAAVRTNIIGQILSFFRRSRRPAAAQDKAEEKPAEEGEAAAAPAAEATNAAEGEQVEEVCQKVEATETSPAAVAAN